MNEKPEGTPNPLNPNPDAPTEATPAEATPAPAEPAAAPEEKAPEEKPATDAAPVAATEPAISSEKPAGKKKTGLIVCLVILLLALIGGGVAAALLLGGGNNGGGADGVSKAIVKLLSGDFSKKVTTKGTVTVSTSSDEMPFTTVGVNLNIGYDGEAATSSGKADVTVDLTDGGLVNASIDEVFTNKKLYLKVANNSEDATTNCANDTTDNCVPTSSDTASMVNMAINMLAGTWIKVPVDEMISSGSMSIVPSNEATKCLTEAMQTKSTDGGIDFAALYKENEFVKYTTEGVSIAKKSYPVYKLTFDAEKLAGFANAFAKSAKDSPTIAKCMGTVEYEDVSADEVAEFVGQVPPIYVEVNGDNDFTRLYFTYTVDEANISIKADLEFDYKASVTATEPSDSVDFQDLMSGFGGGIDYDDDDYDDDDYDYDDDDWDW